MKNHISTIILTLVVLISLTSLSAVFDDYEPSVRARGMGGAFNTTSDDATGIFYNPAGLVKSKGHVAISYTRLFNNDFSELKTGAFTMPISPKLGSIGVGFQAFDVDYLDVNLMSEKIYTLAHSFTLLKDVHSEFNFGYSANLYHLSLDRFGNETAFGVSIGGIATLHQRTRLAFSATNLNNPKIGENNREEIPQHLAIGIAYLPYTGVTTSIELKKPFGGTTEIHAGSEIAVHELLTLRLGVRNEPTSFSAGAMFNFMNIKVDYAYNTHSVLSGTHHFGVGYGF